MIPTLAIVRVESEHFWCPAIPVPLFLLWVLMLLFSPIILVGLIVGWAVCLAHGYPMEGDWRVMAFGVRAPGTHVRVTAEGKHVTVRIL